MAAGARRMANPIAGQRVGEVTASHTERVEGQCYELHAPPPLGALLRIGSPPVYAVVRQIWNAPIDPARPLTPRGADLETVDEVYANNPQLTSVLITRFQATVVGYAIGAAIRHGLPPAPPILHSFVFVCDAGEIAAFTAHPGYLKLLTAEGNLTADLAMSAFLRQAADAASDKRGFLLRAGRTLATELADDGPRLRTILGEMAL